MKIFQTVLVAAVAAFVFAVAPAHAGDGETIMMKDGSYKVITYEGNKKITTVYKPVGTRKVGMVGREPYPVHRSGRLGDEGSYYTEKGIRHFHPNRKLDVEYTGALR